MPSAPKKILKKILKVIAWTVAAVILVLVAVAVAIQIPSVQNWATQKAVSFLQEKIGTKVALQGISISFPKTIVVEGFYLEDQQGDTLFYAGKLSVDTDLWALTRNEIQLNEISLEHTAAFIDRAENDSAFNFTYIIDAFAGDSTAVPDTLEQKSWNITLETLALENIRLSFNDRLEGNHLDLLLGRLSIDMKTFDLENNTFAVEAISLENTTADIAQTRIAPAAEEPANTADSTAALIFSLEEITLRNIKLDYEQAKLGQLVMLNVGEAKVVADKIDLQRREIRLNTISLVKTFAALHQHKPDTVLQPTEQRPTERLPDDENDWTIGLTKLHFSGNSIQYYDFTQPNLRGALDFNHLWVTGFDIDAGDILYDGPVIKADLNNLAMREQSGFAIRSFRTGVSITNTEASITNFLLLTGNSRLQMNAKAEYPSFEDIAETYPQATLTTDVNDTYVNLKDIFYFQPSLRDSLPLRLSPETNLHVGASIRGRLSDLEIRHLDLHSLADTHIEMSGRATGLPDMDKARLDISLDRFYTTRADLASILPDTLLPDSIQPPAWINLQARLDGTLKKAQFTTAFTSTDGSIESRGTFDVDSTSSTRGLDVVLLVNDLDVGSILGQPDSLMDKLKMQAEFTSRGLSLEEMNGTLKASVDHLGFRGYEYKNLKLNGKIYEQIASLTGSMSDENLNFNLEADYSFQDQVPKYEFTFDLKNADFGALNLSQDPVRARGILEVNMATADFKVLNGNVDIRKVAIFNGDKLYAIDSLLFASIDQEGKAEINVDSDLLQAHFEGTMNIFALPGVMREYFNSYYSLHDSLDVEDSPPQHFRFDVQLKNTDLLTELLVPELSSFVPGAITGEFDSESHQFDLRMDIEELQYGNIGITSFALRSDSDEKSFRYNLLIDEVMVDSMRIDGIELNGMVANDSLSTQLLILDSIDRQKYVLAGTFFSREEHFELRLADIMLNYQTWLVPENNYVQFGGVKFVAQNVELSNGPEKISIASERSTGSPTTIAFTQVDLEHLTSMFSEERLLSGLLDGNIATYTSESGMTFTSDLSIADIKVREVAWGDLSVQVEQQQPNRFDVGIGLTGNRNDVAVNGYYNGGPTPSMDITAVVRQFNLTSLQPLLEDQVRNLEGMLTGEIHAGGSPNKPDVDGDLVLRGTKFFSVFLNTDFSIKEETIGFTDEGISFDAFEIADDRGNTARLNGSILTRAYDDFRFNLDLTTENFRLLNTTEDDNDLFYGKIDIRANATIRGDMTTPVVNVDIGLADDSNLTYIVPQAEASALQNEGIVKFVDRSFEGDPFMKQVSGELSDTVKSTFTGIDLTARVELTDGQTFSIVIDPVTKDQLTIRGNSTLTLQVDPSGDMNLTGRYEIEEGTYDLSFYKFVRRKFQIEKGSFITWLGDPLNAQMDIRAIFNVETSPVELFSNQLTGADPNEVNRYKQRLPFMVYLNITGELLQPEIGFKLDMPMSNRNAFGGNVYARIQDINTRESDLNKQVFALLILKRFISDDPFENKAGGGLESTARSSVSKILSEQLNKLSENIKGVELSFDVKSYEDYSSGEAQGQTELQLGVSKSLFNERLVVKLSGNIDIEGNSASRSATDYIGDLALEYKITPDGRFRITGFRNSNYDIIDGELTETGAGLIYVKDYNSLSELFKSNAETKD